MESVVNKQRKMIHETQMREDIAKLTVELHSLEKNDALSRYRKVKSGDFNQWNSLEELASELKRCEAENKYMELELKELQLKEGFIENNILELAQQNESLNSALNFEEKEVIFL